MVNVLERGVAISGEDREVQHGDHMLAYSHSTVVCAPEKPLHAAGEGNNVEPLLLGIGATVTGLLLWYAITVFIRLQIGILAIVLH